jgi:glutathione synthase
MRLLIAISRVAVCEATHTTIHVAATALARGHQVFFVEPWDFEIDASNRVVMRAYALDEPARRDELVRRLSDRVAPRRYLDLSHVDALLLRVNPLDPAVILFAQLAVRAGLTVHNDPSSLLLTGHKGYLATLADVPRPRTLVTRSRAAAILFASEYRSGVVVKPARSSGGRGVSLVPGGRQKHKVEAAFNFARFLGDGYVVVQEYLAEAEEGEKRLVWLDGALIGGYLRSRAPGEFRHNLVRGGCPRTCTIDETDHVLCRALSPHLKRDGVWLAGIDVIGGKIVEVNTLNPGGVHFGEILGGTRMAECIVRSLEDELAGRRSWVDASAVERKGADLPR